MQYRFPRHAKFSRGTWSKTSPIGREIAELAMLIEAARCSEPAGNARFETAVANDGGRPTSHYGASTDFERSADRCITALQHCQRQTRRAALSWHSTTPTPTRTSREDVANKSRGNRAYRTCLKRILARPRMTVTSP